MKGLRKYFIFLGLLFVGYVLLEYYRPKPIDWTETLSNKDKIPYGTFVLYEQLPEFMGNNVQSVRLPIYNQLEEFYEEDRNYIFINQFFNLSEEDLLSLVDFAEAGGQVFIAAEAFDNKLTDTLGISLEDEKIVMSNDSVKIKLLPPLADLPKQPHLHTGAAAFYFVADTTAADSAVAVAMDTLAVTENNRPVLVHKQFGEGNFYLCSVPLLFSNYYLLRSNSHALAAAHLLSYLPQQPTWWDEYQKQGRIGEQSELRVIMSYEALRWAYYLTLAGVFLFMIFESKRRQRIIPEITPPANTTLQFTEAVAALYYKSKDHKLLAQKKILYFRDYLRQHLNIPPHAPVEELREQLELKTDLEEKELKHLLGAIHMVQSDQHITEGQLIRINKAIEDVYQRLGAHQNKSEKSEIKE